MRLTTALLIAAGTALTLAPSVANAQAVLASGSTTLSSNFDALNGTGSIALSDGWKMGAVDSYSGAAATGTAVTTLSSSSGGNAYVFRDSVGDEAIGFLTSGSYLSPKSVYFAFTNSTGSTITDLSLAWDYEKFRSGSRAFGWTFFHGSTNSVDTAASSGDQAYAADAANTTITLSNNEGVIAKSLTLSGLSIATGSTYYFEWKLTGVGGSTNGQALGIDNFSLTATLQALVTGNYWAPGVGGGGAGTWSSASATWSETSGTQGTASQATTGALVFGGTGGAITVSGTVTANAGLTFSADAYALTGGTVTLGGANAAANTITTDTAVGASIGSTLSASNGLTKAGNGILTLGGSNTLGAVAVSAGTLKLGHASALGTTAAGTSVSSGATLDLNGLAVGAEALTLSGTLSNSAAGAASLSGAVAVSGSAAVATTGNLTLSGGSSGSGALTKSGNGTLTLSGASTFGHASGTTVNAGTLALSGVTHAGDISVASGATLSGNGTVTGAVTLVSGGALNLASHAGASTLTAGSLSLAGNAVTLELADLVSLGSGVLTLSGTNTLTLSGSLAAGTYNLITFGSSSGSGTFDIAGLTGYSAVGSLGATSYSVTLTQLAKDLVWNGGTGTWNTSDASWLEGATAATFTAGDNVTIGGSSDQTVTLAADQTVGSLAFSPSAGTTTLTGGAIAGSGAITKTGNGTVVLENANTFTGAVTVSAGKLVVANASALGTTAAGTTVASGAEISLRGVGSAFSESVSLGGGLGADSGTNTVGGTVTLTGDASLTAAASSGLTLSNQVAGASRALSVSGAGDVTLSAGASVASLAKSGDGALTISGASTVTSGTTLSAGALNLNHATALGNGTLTINGGALGNTSGSAKSIANAVTVGGDFAIGTSASNGALTLSGNVDLGGADRAVTVTQNGATLSGNVTNGSLAKSGAAALTLSGSNSLTNLSVNEGSVSLGSSGALGGAAVTVASGAKLQLNGQNAAVTGLSGTGTVENGGAANSTLTLNVASSAAVSAALADGAGAGKLGLAKSGNGTLTLNAAGTNTGAVAINAGSVVAGASGALGSGLVTMAGGTSLLAANGTTQANNLSVGSVSAASFSGYWNFATAAASTTTGNVTFGNVTQGNSNGAVTMLGSTSASSGYTLVSGTAASGTNNAGIAARTGVLSTGANGSAYFEVTLDAASNIALTSVQLGSRSTGTGPTALTVYLVDGGVLTSLGSAAVTANSTWAASSVAGTPLGSGDGSFAIRIYGSGGTGTASAGTANWRIDDLLISGTTAGASSPVAVLGVADSGASATFSGAISFVGDAELTSASGSTATFSGNLSGAGAITKTGSGSVLFSGSSNTFTGATTVSAGTLQIAAASALGATSAGTTVSSGATLDLNGQTVGAEALTLSGTLANTSATAASLSGAVSLSGSAAIAATGDLALSGNVSGTGSLSKSGNGALTLSGNNDFSGAATVSAGTLKLGHASALGTTAAGTSVSSGATLDLNGLAVGAEALALSGTLANSSATAASLSGLVTASGSAAIATTGNLTLSGGTTGSGSLTKSGNGTLTLTGATAHSGGTTVSAGTLATSGSGTLTGDVTLASGTTLTLAGATTLGSLSAANSTLNLAFNSSSASLVTSALNLSDTLTLNLAGLGASPAAGTYQILTFSSLTGAGSINLGSSLAGYSLVGTLGADSYSVAITLLAKSLSWGGGDANWTVGGGNWSNVSTSAPDTFANGDQVAFGPGIDGGTITVGEGVTFGSLAVTAENVNLSFAGAGLAGAGNVTLDGTGSAVTFGSANTFTGTVRVNKGVLNVTNDQALGATSAGTTVGVDGVLILGNGVTVTGEALSLGGTLMSLNGASTYAGEVTLTGAGAVIGTSSADDSLSVSGAVSGADTILWVNSQGAVALSGGLTAASLLKSGEGALTLSAASNLAGGTQLDAGTINLNHATALGNGTLTINGGALGNSSGSAKTLSNAVSVGGNFALGTASSDGALTLSGAVNLGDSARTVSVTGSNTLSGAVTNGSLTKSGNGTLTLSGSNTLSGLTVAAGTLRMGSANALGGSSVTVDSGATLELNGQNATLTALSGSGAVANGGSANSTLTLNVASSASVSASFADGLGGGKLGLTKSGNGALTLSSASTNSGAVAITKGSVAANVSGALGSGAVTLAAGATLAAGNGTSHANAITIGATSLTENFNALASGLPTGWTVRTGATASALGTTVTPLTAATDWGTGAGSNTSGNFRNAASVGSGLASNASFADQAAATDRALASRLTGSFGDPGAAFVYQFSTLGQTLQGLSVDVQMLSVQTRSNTWTLQVASGAAPTSWTTLGTYTDPGAFGSTTLSYDAAALASIANQETAWFRMATLSASTSTGSRDTVGIDNFTLLYGGTNAVLGVTDIDSVASFSGGLTLSGSANLTAASGSDATFSGAISGAGAITKVGAGRVILSGNNAGFSGGITVTAGTLELGSANALGSGAVTVQGGQLNFGGYGFAGTVNLAGGTLGGTGNLLQDTILSVNTGGTLTLVSSGEYGLATLRVNGGTLDLNDLDGANAITVISGTLLNASNWLGQGVASGTGDVTSVVATLAGAGLSVQLGAGQSANLAGISADVVLNGGSVTALTGFTGDLRVDSGTVNLSSVSGLSSYSGSIEVRTGATVDFGSTASAVAINYVGGTVAGSAYTGTVTVGNGVSLTLGSGAIASGATVRSVTGSTIDAAGATNTLLYTGGTVSGLDTFTGSLTVDDSKLVREGVINTTVTLASGGALGGNTQIVGNLVQESGSSLAPGNSPGLTMVGGNHVLAAGAKLELEVLSLLAPVAGTDYDAVMVLGSLNLSGLDTFNRYIIQLTSIDGSNANATAFGFVASQGFQLTLFQAADINLGSNASLADLFDIRTDTSGLAFLGEDGVTAIDASLFSVYQDGNNVILAYAPIPEPSTYGLILGGLALAGAAVRRRQKSKAKGAAEAAK